MRFESLANSIAFVRSGAPNEVWSYGEEVYGICEKYLRLRYEMKDYVRELMKAAHEKGSPIMRPLFYDFPSDGKAWTIETQYMFGPKYLCCPVLKAGERKSKVYLPAGARWTNWNDKTEHSGGETVEVDAPLDYMPVFVRD